MDSLPLLDPISLLLLVLLIAARLAPVIVLAPYFGGPYVPLSIRLALTGALSLLLTALLSPTLLPDLQPPTLPPATWIALAFKELLLGTLLAIIASAVLWGAGLAGGLIDRLRGHPLSEPGQSPTGQLTLLVASALFLTSGGHLLLITALARSFQSISPLSLPTLTTQSTLPFLLDLLAELFILAAALALPVAVVLALADIALAFLERSAPHLSYALGHLSLRATLGLLVFLLTLRIALDAVVGGSFDALGAMEGLMDVTR